MEDRSGAGSAADEGAEPGGPAAPPPLRGDAPGSPAPSKPAEDYRILLVDDDAATLMAMKQHLLRMKGGVKYQVTTVESAADALALLKEGPSSYDLVLTGAGRPLPPALPRARHPSSAPSPTPTH
jgi:hypothetical protein